MLLTLLAAAAWLPATAEERVPRPAAGPQPARAAADAGAVLPLATAGPAVLPPLSATSSGCCLQPLLRCSGPDYRGCTPRIYYGTNPNDDDFVRELESYPPHAWWHERALRMVVRKKRVAEVLDH